MDVADHFLDAGFGSGCEDEEAGRLGGKVEGSGCSDAFGTDTGDENWRKVSLLLANHIESLF